VSWSERGAAKIYGAARDPAAVTEPGLTPIALNNTYPERPGSGRNVGTSACS